MEGIKNEMLPTRDKGLKKKEAESAANSRTRSMMR